MLEQTGVALVFYAHFVETKVGKTGLTVTVDVYRNASEIVTGGSATEVGDGIYKYELASGSNTVEGEYICIFKTVTSTVDQQHIPALWVVNKAGVENLNAAVGDVPTNSELTSALASADDAVLSAVAAVPAAVLSAATSDPIAANIEEVNAVAITGDGAATPWGPA